MKRSSLLLIIGLTLVSCRKAGHVVGQTVGEFGAAVGEEMAKPIIDSANRASARADVQIQAARDKAEAEKARKAAAGRSQWDARTQQFPPGFTPTNKDSWKK